MSQVLESNLPKQIHNPESTFLDLPDDPNADRNAPPHRSITVDSLFTVGGEEPQIPQLTTPIAPAQYDRIRYLYLNEYAPGLDALLETRWYTQAGLECLLANPNHCAAFVGMLKLFEDTKSDNYDQMRLLPLTESRMIWHLMCMPRAQSWALIHEPIMDEVMRRLDVFESLLTGKPYSTPSSEGLPLLQPGTREYRQQTYWRELSSFVAYTKTSVQPAQEKTGLQALIRMRQLLDGMENRDVLYSLAVVRHYGPRTKGKVNQEHGGVEVGGQLNEEEKAAFAVAKKYVEDEAAGKGTSQVMQRVCGMAVRSWAAMELW